VSVVPVTTASAGTGLAALCALQPYSTVGLFLERRVIRRPTDSAVQLTVMCYSAFRVLVVESAYVLVLSLADMLVRSFGFLSHSLL
jgi:hypothetical protein